MGRLTDDMARLRAEIDAGGRERRAFVQGLKESPTALRDQVADMRAGFRAAQAETARKGRAERREFALGLKEAVAAQRRAFAEDLAGARRAWAGRGDRETSAPQPRKAPARKARRTPGDTRKPKGG